MELEWDVGTGEERADEGVGVDHMVAGRSEAQQRRMLLSRQGSLSSLTEAEEDPRTDGMGQEREACLSSHEQGSWYEGVLDQVMIECSVDDEATPRGEKAILERGVGAEGAAGNHVGLGRAASLVILEGSAEAEEEPHRCGIGAAKDQEGLERDVGTGEEIMGRGSPGPDHTGEPGRLGAGDDAQWWGGCAGPQCRE